MKNNLGDHVDSRPERLKEKKTIRTIIQYLTILTDDPGLSTKNKNFDDTYNEKEIMREEVSTLRQSRRRLPPKVSASHWRRSTTPEREVPISLEETSENVMSTSRVVGTITPDCLGPNLIEISPKSDFELDITDPRRHRGGEEKENFPIKEQHCCSRTRANKNLAAAIFSHPQPLHNFCLEVYQTVKEQGANTNAFETDTLVEYGDPVSILNGHLDERRTNITKIPRDIYCERLPIFVITDFWNAVQELILDVSFATVNISVFTLDASVHVVMNLCGVVARVNPLILVNGIITRPLSMMGMSTGLVVSGIQSVATGIGSAGSVAINLLSAKNRSPLSPGLVASKEDLWSVHSSSNAKKVANKKLLRKLNNLNSAAPVVSYTALSDHDGGLSRHAKSRVQKMMHYDVSLRPFVATIKVQESPKTTPLRNDHFLDDADIDSESSSPFEGPFMCTPQSFPSTPASRAHVLKRGSRFADDVIFLARDQLRVHYGLGSSNHRTREMAKALKQGKRLAVFEANDASSGIDLSCGQHVATKIGNVLYCSSRSMVPILRNCFVYFEMTVLGCSSGVLQTSMATLSFGLSTKEMPATTLVGAWKGSIGLCTTGQILISGQWCSPGPDPSITPFGNRETVGCLVCLDDNSAFETWEGVMITATVIFNINGRLVNPQLPRTTISGSGGHSLATFQTNIPIGAVPPTFTLPLLLPAEEELYPTLTLHSPGTSVMCRFSAEDVIARSRDAIGAPKKVTVYAVDGSIVFTGEE